MVSARVWLQSSFHGPRLRGACGGLYVPRPEARNSRQQCWWGLGEHTNPCQARSSSTPKVDETEAEGLRSSKKWKWDIQDAV